MVAACLPWDAPTLTQSNCVLSYPESWEGAHLKQSSKTRETALILNCKTYAAVNKTEGARTAALVTAIQSSTKPLTQPMTFINSEKVASRIVLL